MGTNNKLKNCLEKIISYDEEGSTVLKILQKWRISRSLLIKLKKNQQIYLNGNPVRVNTIVNLGDILTVYLDVNEISSVEPEPLPLQIIYEDQDILLLDKPAGMLVHPTNGQYSGTLANGVIHYLQKQGYPPCFRPIHRLDRDTSGLIIIGKNQYASSILAKQAKQKVLQREYLTIVEGRITKDTGTIDAPIARKSSSIIEREVSQKGQASITHYSVIQRLPSATLLKISLETGRTHQIRVHMAYIGHPIVGDTLYGKASSYITRHALHSNSASFFHPRTNKFMSFFCPLPKDMEKLIKSLRDTLQHT